MSSRLTRKVRLPSGRSVQIVEIGASNGAPAAPRLEVCRRCGSELVQPTAWEAAGPGRLKVWLRCPDCEWTGAGVHGDATVARFDEVFDRGTEALVDDLARLVRATMEDDVERFCAALRAGHVLPEDF